MHREWIHTRGGVLQRMAGLWQRLTRPAPSLGEPHRRRARLLTSLLLVLLPVGPLADGLRLLVDPEYHLLADPGWPVMVGALGALSLLYALSRTERYVLTTRLTIVLVMGGTCQRTWEHAVPKTAKPVGPRISVQFRPTGIH